MSKKWWIAFPSAILVATLLIGGKLASDDLFYEPNPAVQDQDLRSRGISISTAITDDNRTISRSFKNGDTVSVTITLANTSDQQSRYLTLKTGLDTNDFVYVHAVQGADSVFNKDGQIAFSNIVMQPHQSQSLSFKASVNSNTDKKVEANSSLIDTSNKSVTSGNSVKFSVAKTTPVNSQITAKKVGE